MIILGIETSCDETAAAVLSFDSAQDYKSKGRIQILSNVVASSALLQAKYGGIIPEQAAREQIKSIIPVIEEALKQANLTRHPELGSGSNRKIPKQVRNDMSAMIPAIDAIAVTQGPGLIGSLLVGVETAKTLAIVWNKPLIPINHLIGHFYANWIESKHLQGTVHLPGEVTDVTSDSHLGGGPTFPCIGLLVSGGHTDLVLFTGHGKYKYLGGTRDDAAGECFDKCARLLGLPYPGGPEISKLATKGDPTAFDLPRPMIDSDDFDFSFSGLKTAVANVVNTNSVILGSGATPESDSGQARMTMEVSNLAASIEAAIAEVLVTKTVRAAQSYNVEQIMVAGGVAANQKLISDLKFKVQSEKLKIELFVPPPILCTDNAAMITSAAFFQKPLKDPLKLQADPNLSLAY